MDRPQASPTLATPADDKLGYCAIHDLRLQDFRPRAEVRLPEHRVTHPRFPVIDVHVHLGPEFSCGWYGRDAAELVPVLDEMGVETIVDLDGGWGEHLDARIAAYQACFPGRFLHFARVDWHAAFMSDDPGEYAANQLRDSVRRGAWGLKVWKNLGLRLRDEQNRLVPVDDERLDPLWVAAGELSIPVLIHAGDPAAFFQPLDNRNERIEQLLACPQWQIFPDFPSLEEIMGQLERMVLRHSNTIFIGAHVGCYAEDLSRVAALMERAPNWYVDISARVAELGRQPRATRAFIEAHPDRILFGTDTCGRPEENAVYYRFLETEDEYFSYRPDPDDYCNGRWRIYGLGLSDDLLRAVYRENARRILGL
jgi:predicted TIM-barrel fold metal-dependent hydrolase